jgi:hypothetical protein
MPKHAFPSEPPGATGQLWEECECCGREPIYMPHMVCVACWPPAAKVDGRRPLPGERFDKNDEPKD